MKHSRRPPRTPWLVSWHQSTDKLKTDIRYMLEEIVCTDPYRVRISVMEQCKTKKDVLNEIYVKSHVKWLKLKTKQEIDYLDPSEFFGEIRRFTFKDVNEEHDDRDMEIIGTSKMFKQLIIKEISKPEFDLPGILLQFDEKLLNSPIVGIEYLTEGI